MKKFFSLGALCFIIMSISPALFASGRNLNGNMSAEWGKTLNRYASTDADAAFFNPAGTAFMPDGTYIYLGDEIIWQPVDIKVRGGDTSVLAGVSKGEYKGSKEIWYFPVGYLIIKKDRFSIAGGSNALGGGGIARYNSGLQQFDVALNQGVGLGSAINNIYNSLGFGNPIGNGPIFSKFWASSAVYNIQLTMAYEVIKDKLSISVGGRFLIGNTDVDINLLTTGATTNGFFGAIPFGSDFHAYQLGYAGGAIAGICYKPIQDLTMAVTASWNSPLQLRTKSFQSLIVGLQDSGLKNTGTSAQQIPAAILVGIAYRAGGLQISPSFAYEFNQFAQWKGRERGYTGGYDAGLGLDYTFKGTPVNIGIGYLWAFQGARPSSQDQLHEELNSHSASLGFTFALSEKVKLTISEVYTRYVPENVNAGALSALRFIPARFYKDSYLTAVGLTVKL